MDEIHVQKSDIHPFQQHHLLEAIFFMISDSPVHIDHRTIRLVYEIMWQIEGNVDSRS